MIPCDIKQLARLSGSAPHHTGDASSKGFLREGLPATKKGAAVPAIDDATSALATVEVLADEQGDENRLDSWPVPSAWFSEQGIHLSAESSQTTAPPTCSETGEKPVAPWISKPIRTKP